MGSSENERRFAELLASREPLDDEQFFEQFFADSGISHDLVAGARSELQEILGYNLDAIHPADNIAVIFDGLDFTDVFYRMERRFKVLIPLEAFPKQVDGTFDTMVRFIHSEGDWGDCS